jgi:alpha-tubulin suppressor-like RCC1 family protein
MGANDVGELGDGTTNNVDYPEQIVPSGVTAIAAGMGFSIFTKSDGSLWFIGVKQWLTVYSGPHGGVPTNSYTTIPQQIVNSGVMAIAAGFEQMLFLQNDGSLWSMCGNGAGELGDGTFNSTGQPQPIVSSGVVAIAAGSGISLFLKSDGSLWGMGDDSNGALGTTNSTMLYGCFVRPQQIVSGGFTAIAADASDTILLKSDGSLWGMGEDSDGQLAVRGTYYSPVQIVASGVTAIAAGAEKTLFTKSDGSLWGMGDVRYGGLGVGDYDDHSNNVFPGTFPVQIVAGPPGYNHTSVQLLNGGNVQLSFLGIAGTNYALDHSFSLAPPVWLPLATNPAGSGGVLVFTNTPDPTTNSFWRVRSVP